MYVYIYIYIYIYIHTYIYCFICRVDMSGNRLGERLLFAAEEGKLEEVEALLQQGVSFNYKDEVSCQKVVKVQEFKSSFR